MAARRQASKKTTLTRRGAGADIYKQIRTLSLKIGKPKHFKTDLMIDRKMISQNAPVAAVLWGVRDTGTHTIILRDAPYIPKTAQTMFGYQTMDKQEMMEGIIKAVTSSFSNEWYFITPNSARKIAPKAIRDKVNAWIKKGNEVVTGM